MTRRTLGICVLLAATGGAAAAGLIGWVPQTGAAIPLDATFHDETGRTVRLGDYFNTRPVILNLVYFQCPGLCGQELTGLLSALRAIPLEAGKDVQVITVSFDPREQPVLAASKKRFYIDRYKRFKREDPGASWVFLTGDQANVRRLADAVGFHYTYDKETDQFNHPAGLVILAPDGRISRYFNGIEYPPRDLWLALLEASGHSIQSAMARFWLHLRWLGFQIQSDN